jgi:hypothetical protein
MLAVLVKCDNSMSAEEIDKRIEEAKSLGVWTFSPNGKNIIRLPDNISVNHDTMWKLICSRLQCLAGNEIIQFNGVECEEPCDFKYPAHYYTIHPQRIKADLPASQPVASAWQTELPNTPGYWWVRAAGRERSRIVLLERDESGCMTIQAHGYPDRYLSEHVAFCSLICDGLEWCKAIQPE